MLVLLNVIMEPSSLVPIHLLLATKCSCAEAFYYSSQPGTNLFIMFLTNGSSSILFEWPKEEANISKYIIYIRKKYKTLII